MRDRLLLNWDLARGLRLVFAVVFLFAGIADQEPLAYAAAVFFGMQAVFNIGCCGAACASGPQRNAATISNEEVTYEEIR